MAVILLRKELSYTIPIEEVVSDQDCIQNFSSICTMKKTTGQDLFFAAKILNLTDKPCDTTWEIKDTRIGENSDNASIYEGECKDKKPDGYKHALKYIELKDKSSFSLKQIANEINIQQKIYKESGLTTPVYQIFLNNDYLMFVTDKLKVTVFRYIYDLLTVGKVDEKNITLIKKILERCFEICHVLMVEHDIYHGDEHLNNFMLTDDFDPGHFNPDDVKIIDFGKAYYNNKLSSSAKKNKIEQQEYGRIINLFKRSLVGYEDFHLMSFSS